MPTIILFAVWKNFGYNMIIFLAGLQAIPEDLYEAARIDGASRWRQFRHVTLPMLGPALLLVGILTMAGYFQLFAEPYVMTQGGPLQSTVSVLYLMYEEGFKWWNLGNASAVAFLLFLLMLGVTSGAAVAGAAQGGGMNDAHVAVLVVNGAAARRCAAAEPGAAAVDAVGVVHAAGRGEPFPAAAAAARARRSHNYRELFAARAAWAATCSTALLIATLTTLLSLLFNTLAGYAFAKLRFAGRERVFRALLGGAGDPGAGGDDAAVPAAQAAGPGQHLRRRDGAGHGQRVRHLPGAPVRALAPGRTARSRAHRRRRRAAHLLRRSCCRRSSRSW